MLAAVSTGWGDGAVIGRSRRFRIFRLPAAWCRCGIVFTRNLLGTVAVGSVYRDPMCQKSRGISSFIPVIGSFQTPYHAWLRSRTYGRQETHDHLQGASPRVTETP